MLPWLYEAAFWLFGSASLWPLRVLALGAHLTTAALLAALARRRWGDRAGVVAGVGYALLSIGLSPEDTQAATFEVFMLPATVLAFWFAQNSRWAAAGFATAVAALTKQTGGAVLFPVLWLLWRGLRGSDGLARRDAWLRLGLGFLLPVSVIALVTGPAHFVFWVVSGSSDYASLDGAWLTMLGRAFGNLGILGAAGLGLLVPLATGLRRSLREDRDIWIWLAASVAGVLTGLHFFGHYYLQLMPPLVLLGTGALARLTRRQGLLQRFALGYGALAATVFCVLGFVWPHQPLQQATSVAEDVTRDTSPQETVLVWGMHPEIYWLADRIPGTRYLTAGLLTNFAGGRDGKGVGVDRGMADSWATFEAEMKERLPEVFVDYSDGAPYAPQNIAPIRQLLADHYTLVGRDGDAVIYRMRPSRQLNDRLHSRNVPN
ncbi:glycosyltransferase family 39 protein [Streptacidiphilus monticola]